MMPSCAAAASAAARLNVVAAAATAPPPPPPICNPYSRTMGIQSQNRDGSVKACKKRGTKAKAGMRKRLNQIAI